MCFDRYLLCLFKFICTLHSTMQCTAVLANGQQVTTATQGRESDGRAPPGCTAQTTPASPSDPRSSSKDSNNKSVTHERFPRPAITHQSKVRLTTQATAVARCHSPSSSLVRRPSTCLSSSFPHLPGGVAGVSFVCHLAHARIHARTHASLQAPSSDLSPDGKVRDVGCANLESLFYSSRHTPPAHTPTPHLLIFLAGTFVLIS
ncbi:hypothetical protein CGRA01v4_06392 [Colletotrichum graminicola]|nr:hypothetical protein CGRA01v4_06392 [Colletotrichum graminicola]